MTPLEKRWAVISCAVWLVIALVLLAVVFGLSCWYLNGVRG
jgi:ABC-type multidrug transport system permease subunit